MAEKPTAQKAPRRPSKADKADILFAKLEKAIAEGKTADEAMEMLTPAQYDFLCSDEFGARLDALTTTKEQREATAKARQVSRDGKPRGHYTKKYSDEKQRIYAKLVETVQELGGEVIPRERENFRDLDFMLSGKHYRIVFSNPRT